jgi:hypothetical protein
MFLGIKVLIISFDPEVLSSWAFSGSVGDMQKLFVYIFISGLFNDTLNSSDYVVSDVILIIE